MKLWAFGVSPHGLGLAPEVFWSLDAAEFFALKDVHDAALKRWAIEMACHYNATYDADGVPWTAGDFLPGGDRAARMRQHLIGKVEAAKVTVELAQMKAGDTPEGLPSWLFDAEGKVIHG